MTIKNEDKDTISFPIPSMFEVDRLRYLHFNPSTQGQLVAQGLMATQGLMSIEVPNFLVLEYAQRMMAWLLFVPSTSVQDRKAMTLGLGAASLTKFCYKTLGMRTVAVEINPAVIEMCHQWFMLPANDDRLYVVRADAAQEIQRTRWLGAIDALAVDAYDHEAAAPVLDTLDFYKDRRAALTDDGVMSVNLYGRDTSYAASLSKIRAVFGENCVWSFESTASGNTVVMAFRSPVDTENNVTKDVLTQRAEEIELRWCLPAKKWLKTLKLVA